MEVSTISVPLNELNLTLYPSDELATLIDMHVKALWRRMQSGDCVPFAQRKERKFCEPSIVRLPGVTALGHSDRERIREFLEESPAGTIVGYCFLGEGDQWQKLGSSLWALSPFRSSFFHDLDGLLIPQEGGVHEHDATARFQRAGSAGQPLGRGDQVQAPGQAGGCATRSPA